MSDGLAPTCLMQAVGRYFDLMYTNDVDAFDSVFAESAQLHGMNDGTLRWLRAPDYKAILATAPSPASKGAERREEVLLLDFTSSNQAMVKVRVRIDTVQYVDYLAFHRVDDAWRVTAKSFHIERRFD